MTPSHHIARTRRYLQFAAGDAAAGDHDRAARNLARAASHTATAVAVHWRHPTGSRRRLQFALDDQAQRGNITYSQAGVLRQAYALPDRLADAETGADAFRILRRTRIRIRHLLHDIVAAMTGDPNPPTFEEILARIAAETQPEPDRLSPSPDLARPAS